MIYNSRCLVFFIVLFCLSIEEGISQSATLEQNGSLILGESNSSPDIFINAGSDNKIWSIISGSTPNPNNNGIDESLQIGMNIPTIQGYLPALNSLKMEFETNYKDLQNGIEYDEWYLQWRRAANGKDYRQLLTAFNEYGGIPKLETTFIGKIEVKSTTDLDNFSTTPSNFYIEDRLDGKINMGGFPDLSVSKLEISFENEEHPTMRLGSGSVRPSLGFYNYSSNTGLQPTYARVEMQNISNSANFETGRLHFKLRNNGIENIKFTMHENGFFGINRIPNKSLHILDQNFVNGETSTVIALEGDNFGGQIDDGLRIGFGTKNSSSYPIGIFGKTSWLSYNVGFDLNGVTKVNYNLNSEELEVTGKIITGYYQFNTQHPIDGSGVPNGSFFYGVNGGLYFKGGNGTVTQIAPQ